MTFLQYLRTQKHRNDPIGDFAREAIQDKTKSKPRGMSSISMWHGYLNYKSSCQESHRVLEESWENYINRSTVDGV